MFFLPDMKVTNRIQAGWENWKEVMGILCERRVPVRLKVKMYKTLVRPALMCGIGNLVLNKAQVNRMREIEMKMLRWVCH